LQLPASAFPGASANECVRSTGAAYACDWHSLCHAHPHPNSFRSISFSLDCWLTSSSQLLLYGLCRDCSKKTCGVRPPQGRRLITFACHYPGDKGFLASKKSYDSIPSVCAYSFARRPRRQFDAGSRAVLVRPLGSFTTSSSQSSVAPPRANPPAGRGRAPCAITVAAATPPPERCATPARAWAPRSWPSGSDETCPRLASRGCSRP
jgi:hypothetical protein